MPPTSLYTPLESLLFFQSLAGLDRRPENFASIADFLKNNPFIRENARFDANRLTPQALEELYTDAIKGDGGETLGRRSPEQQQQLANGQQDGSKTTPPGDGRLHSTVISGLVSRLYARYRELITKEIQEDEQKYKDLQNELSKIPSELQARASSLPGAQLEPQVKPTQTPGEISQHDVRPVDPNTAFQPPRGPGICPGTPQNITQPLQSKPGSGPAATTTSQDSSRHGTRQTASAGVTQYRFENKTPQSMQAFHQPQWTGATPQHPINGQPSPPAQMQNAGIPIQPPPHPQSPAFSAPPSTTHNAPAPVNATNARVQPVQGHTNTPAATRPPVPRQAMQGRMIQPWSIHSPQPQQHASPYANPPYSQVPPPGKPQTPQPTIHHNKPSVATPQCPVGVPAGPLTGHPSTGGAKPGVEVGKPSQNIPQVPSTGITRANAPALPLDLKRRGLSVRTSIARTPWKKPTSIDIPTHPGSPVRPQPENLSPVSEREPSPVHGIGMPTGAPKANLEHPAAGTRNRRITPAPRKGRSDSPVSPTTRQTRRRGRSNVSRGDDTDGGQIKNELGTTPMELDDADVTRRTSERRTRSAFSVSDERTGSKRKRTSTDAFTPEETQTSSQHVICTRNFPRTCAPVMNDIAAHKHASIFAKPLTERDAPGYKNLIYRPQDIKSIKSAIHHGSKAVAAASETLNSETSGTPKGNGLILKKTAELIPPKGIVNSSQLEKELIRMFANAVMFNPTPETTFGHAFPMRSDIASRAQTQVSEPEEGGILHDTLEIYEDVERAVSTWRAAERAVDDMGAGKGGAAALRGATGDGNNTESMDDVK